jgi:hypothetical protein
VRILSLISSIRELLFALVVTLGYALANLSLALIFSISSLSIAGFMPVAFISTSVKPYLKQAYKLIVETPLLDIMGVPFPEYFA